MRVLGGWEAYKMSSRSEAIGPVADQDRLALRQRALRLAEEALIIAKEAKELARQSGQPVAATPSRRSRHPRHRSTA
jgi:hypothetical protein